MIEELHQKLIKGETTVRALVDEYRTRAQTDTLNIFREVYEDVEAQIVHAEKLLTKGNATLLTGIPIAIKDNIMFAGHITGSASKMLEHYTASFDSTVVKKLKAAGAIIIGRTNMDEGAMGSSTENSAYGPTKNPLDHSRVPGGSSGGSAAAVAADCSIIALGSDTGGSIRQPAAFCGLVGLLPTYGTVSRHGLISMGSSLDVIGPLAKTVDDAQVLFNIIKGKDEYDATSISHKEQVVSLKKRIAIPRNVVESEGLDHDVRKNFADTIAKLQKEGFTVEEVDLPHLKHSLAVYYIIMPAEVSSNLARLEGIRYGDRIEISATVSGKTSTIHDIYGDTRGALFGKEVRRRILLGTYVLSHGYYDAYYRKALDLRALIKRELETTLADFDALLTPTTPTVSFKLGEKANDPLAMYLSDLFTVPGNIANVPALAVPSGVAENNLPLSVQFLGLPHSEETLFALGKIIEKIR
jgi:aspartyl-tRNA(Asn)/glutamyl-tRNA(Gln) amidotransferase subunit A